MSVCYGFMGVDGGFVMDLCVGGVTPFFYLFCG
jgi:hypothetical protein